MLKVVRGLGVSGWIYIALFLIGPAIAGFLVGVKMFANYLPPGDDPGNWLKRINAFLGNTYPLWGENLASYPPLFHALGALISILVGDSVFAMKILAILSFVLIPITSGWFVYKITDNKQASIVASLVSSFLPMQYEMIWWGAYPNILGMALLPIGVYSITRVLEGESSMRNLSNLVLITLLITLTHHMTAVVFAGILAIVIIVLLALRLLSLRFGIIALISLNIIISYLAHLVSSGYIVGNPVTAGFDLYERLLWAFKSPIILYILIISSMVSIITFVLSWRYLLATVLSAWIMSPVLLSLSHYFGVTVDVGRFMLFLGTPMIVASTTIMPNLKGIIKATKEEKEGGDEPEYFIEINMDKLLPALLIATILVLTPVTAISVNDSAYDYYNWLSNDYHKYTESERLQILQWIKENTDAEDVIIASYHMGRWIEGFSGRRTLMDVPLSTILVRDEFYRSLSAQALLSLNNYEIANGYFWIADQSPLAPTFAPLIYVSNQWGYDPIIYLDDSFVRINFEKDGKTWTEAPFKSWLYQFSMERGEKQAKITSGYQTISLLINKSMEVTQNTPYFKIRYDVTPVRGVKLIEAQITFFIAWGRTIKDFKATENGFRLSTGTSEIVVTFDRRLIHIESGIYEEFNQHRVMIKLSLNQQGDSFTITFNNYNPLSQYPRGWFTSFLETLAEFKPKYIIVPKDHVFHKTKTWSPPYPSGRVVYIEDAFVRAVFTRAGASWIEAPYKGNVTQEIMTENGRIVTYETYGLIFHKELSHRNDEIRISYKVEPKPGSKIESLNVPIWQSWGTTSYINITGSKALIVSDAGSLLMEADEGAVLRYTLDPEFKMPQILASKRAVGNEIELVISIKPLNYLSYLTYEYTSTTRPLMEKGDRIDIIIEGIGLEPVFETTNIIVYKLKWA
jgi:hypothetical protein